MLWLIISVLAYLLVALETILDKFLLSSNKISHPAIYAFYSGILSSFAFLFFPFGFHFIGFGKLFVGILAGTIFIYGTLALFYAIKESDASQVTPVVVATTPIVTYFFSLLILHDRLFFHQLLGVAILISGGLLVSVDLSGRKKDKFFKGFYHAILAGALLALAFTLFKQLYNEGKFINIFIWTRFGLFSGAFSLLLFSNWRKVILKSLYKFRKPQAENYQSSAIFVITKALGGLGSIALNYAISLGSVTIVNALVSLEYAFVFIFEVVLAFWFPSIFKRTKSPLGILQKSAAVVLIGTGVFLVSHIRRYR
jgi:drug/metabolite transporter (DMT)-like permease